MRLRGTPFALADVLGFVADAWPLIRDDPDPARWAREFLGAARAAPARS